MVTGEKLSVGDRIIGAPSSGLHANGISLVIKRALALKDKFLHLLPNGKTLGEEALIPTRSYVRLVEALQEKNIEIHSLLGGTGGGISKIAYAKKPFTYRVKKWVDEIPPLFRFMLETGVSLKDCLTTFNWGIGFYVFVPEDEVDRTIKTGTESGIRPHRPRPGRSGGAPRHLRAGEDHPSRRSSDTGGTPEAPRRA